MKMKNFINFTNHPSKGWSLTQIEAAKGLGKGEVEIKDVSFPNVNPLSSEHDIQAQAEKIANEIAISQPVGVLCQGEFSLAFAVTTLLKKSNIKVFVACSERKSSEKIEDGKTVKTNVFEFVKFREI